MGEVSLAPPTCHPTYARYDGLRQGVIYGGSCEYSVDDPSSKMNSAQVLVRYMYMYLDLVWCYCTVLLIAGDDPDWQYSVGV